MGDVVMVPVLYDSIYIGTAAGVRAARMPVTKLARTVDRGWGTGRMVR